MTGPKVQATRSVPRAWNAKSPIAMIPATSMSMVWGVSSRPGMRVAPSTAERMLIAGVITPSPMKSAIPMIASRDTSAILRPDFSIGSRISLSTIVPPSPFFPSCMARYVYWTVTSVVIVQMISESIPRILSGDGGMIRKMAASA